MASRTIVVTREKKDPSLLPSYLNEFATIAERCRKTGIYRLVEKHLRIPRRPGNADVDQFHFLLSLFSTPRTRSLRSHYERIKAYGPQVAALADRQNIPSSSSLSRYLAAVPQAAVRSFGDELSSSALAPWWKEEMERSTHRDAEGRHWNVFDYDHQRITLARRRLPTGSSYPPPTRMIDGGVEDGIDRRLTHYDHGMLMHSGTGMFLGSFVSERW